MEKHKPISCLAISRHELPGFRLQIINSPCKRPVINGATISSKCAEKHFHQGSNADFMKNQVSIVTAFRNAQNDFAAAQSMLIIFLQTNIILNTKI
jgi:hypothetical protein